ncbi:MAG: prolipoprotein diacylglyceryl transferase [Zoogloeaceae bacterium]|jgi:phosphatidylglycerol:prolipoprotein diacylglycerol transferase|nr:prolipoprotein diacylglyceryl transferase [Zoogloeaceae bacterium]
MLTYPHIDPIAFSIDIFSIHLSVRWYGIMYLLSYLFAWQLARLRGRLTWGEEALENLLFALFVGLVVGGRLGQVLFYAPGYYFAHPLEILQIWKGGMSFHGGFLGVLLASLLWAHRHGKRWLEVTDFIAPLAPLGLMLGRIGNFINGEIVGRVADPSLPWAMVFPHVDALPRHPVQIYHAALEGLALFVILWLYSKKPRPTGVVSGAFLAGYGVFRSTVEFFREPDAGIFGLSYTISMGQWLSIPMILAGAGMLWYFGRRVDAPSPVVK